MKRFLIFLVLLLFSTSANAAVISVAQTGNWSATSTWTGGVLPATDDTISCLAAYTVTVDGNYTVAGGTVARGGGLVIAAGNTLTTTGTLTFGDSTAPRGAALTMQAGSEIVATDASLAMYAINWQTSGTNSTHPAKITGGSITSTTTYKSNYELEHVIFATSSSVSLKPGNNSGFVTVSNLSFKNCVFGSATAYVGAASVSSYASFVMENCDFVGGSVEIGMSNAMSGTKRFVGNTLRATGSTRKDLKFLTLRGMLIQNNIISNYFLQAAGAGAGGHTILNNIIVQTLGEDGNNFYIEQNGNVTGGTDFKDNYIVTGITNTHGISFGNNVANPSAQYYVRGNVFDVSSTASSSGNLIVGTTADLDVIGNLVIGRGSNLFGTAGNTSGGLGIDIYRNTAIATAGGGGDPTLALFETGVGDNYDGAFSVHSNLVWSVASQSKKLIGGSGASDDTISMAGYNAVYNITGTLYDVATITDDQSAADVVLGSAPGFANSTRSIGNWAAAEYSTNGTTDAAVALFLTANGYNSTTGKQDGVVFTRTVPEVVAWVMDGFVPSNADLEGAGLGGVDIGALDYGGGVDPEPEPEPEDPGKFISVTLYSNTTPLANMTGLTAIWWDAVPPLGNPAYSTASASTNANGTLILDLSDYTSLNATQNGFLFVYQHNATDYRKSRLFGTQTPIWEQ